MQYWTQKGRTNTAETARVVLNRAKELGITHVVVASNTGETAEHFLDGGPRVVCVTHHVGWSKPGEDEMEQETRQSLEKRGARVLTTTHLFAGIDRALRYKYQGVYPAEIVSSTLKIFGQGVKVCVEVSVMALDAGLIPYGQEIIAVGGTGRGADTACVILPAHSSQFFDTTVREVLCMPRPK